MGAANGHPPTSVSPLNTAVPTPASRGSPSTPAAGTPDPPGTPLTPGTPATLGTPGTPQTPSKRHERKERKKGAGLTEGDADMEAIPENNLLIVMPCICLVLFLAALDQTIVATALPVIAEKFNATPSQYSWIVTSYQLAMTLLTPVNGRVSDIVGRKPMLYVAIIVFTIFSALCGAAQSAEWLIVCRALQGLGGGTIIGLTSIVVSDIVPLSKRGAYQGFFGATWGIASALGPILGGLLANAPHGGWRWCFFINLPTAGLAFLGLVLKLNLNKPKGHTFQQFVRTFDFVGLLLVMIGGSLLIVGFSFAADHGFKDTAAIAVIVVGAVFMIAAIINCLFTKRNAVIPARMFKIRTTLFYTLASTLHAAAFIPCNILLPQFFMGVNGSSPIGAGVQLLPFAIFVSLGTVVAGQIQSFLRIVRPITWVGYAMAILGFALLHTYFDYDLPRSRQYGLLIIPAMGIGLSLQSPLIIMQAAMPLKEMASVTSAWVLTRSLGGSVGVSIMTAVLNSDLRSEFAAAGSKHGGLDGAEVPTNAEGYTRIHHMPDSPLKWDLLSGFADAFKPVWIVCIAFLAACLVITIPTRSYSLNRTQGGPKTAAVEDDIEAQAGSADYDTEEKLDDADDDTKLRHGAATAPNGGAHRPSADSFQTAAALPPTSSEKRPL